MLLLPAEGPLTFFPLVHKTSVPAGGLFINMQRHIASQLPFSCWFCHRCPSVQQLADVFKIEVGKEHLPLFFQVCVTGHGPTNLYLLHAI